jgi:hypothetical protein
MLFEQFYVGQYQLFGHSIDAELVIEWGVTKHMACSRGFPLGLLLLFWPFFEK